MPRFDVLDDDLITPVPGELREGFSARVSPERAFDGELPSMFDGPRIGGECLAGIPTPIASPLHAGLAIAFDQLELELARLSFRWHSHAPVTRIDRLTRDFAGFMGVVLEDVELEPVYTRSAETAMLVHDTYVRLITVAGALREGIDERWAPSVDLETAYAYAEALLDAFTPFVGIADRAMRRICLERETLEGALRWLGDQLDEEAAERCRAAEAFEPDGVVRVTRNGRVHN
ncbi:MAG: hypothetical protein ABI678_07835 [Kofleriaceae bacterium]